MLGTIVNTGTIIVGTLLGAVMNRGIKEKYKDWDGTEVWEEVVRHVISHKEITTVTGITFNATFVGSCIFLKGGMNCPKGSSPG